MRKFFTVVIEATDEAAARKLVPGESIGPNKIVACSLGNVIELCEEMELLVPSGEELCRLQEKNIRAFLK